MARVWTCRKCARVNPRTAQRCPTPGCGRRRPARRTPSHRQALDAMSYAECVAAFGEVCGICGRAPSARRRLDRDHEHVGDGRVRGLLCARCNRALPSWVTPEWLRAAADYLQRALARSGIGR
jgi:hypothetical protein